MFIKEGNKSPEIITSLNPFCLFIEEKGSLSLISTTSLNLKLIPKGDTILKSFIISVNCSFSDNFNLTVTSSSPLGNLDMIMPLIADLTCSPISEIDNPSD